jgi:hypothetical protein
MEAASPSRAATRRRTSEFLLLLQANYTIAQGLVPFSTNVGRTDVVPVEVTKGVHRVRVEKPSTMAEYRDRAPTRNAH